ncbi:universal stress protein [Streptomyces sp. NPDC057217]|uniref:universal stress protein n=1 Tax=Streptomyces sp. NPDC057217 TaxID=3346054 RepID=UPI003644FB42
MVVGSRGRGGFARLPGSVSRRCALHAECPVVFLRAPEDDPGAAAASRRRPGGTRCPNGFRSSGGTGTPRWTTTVRVTDTMAIAGPLPCPGRRRRPSDPARRAGRGPDRAARLSRRLACPATHGRGAGRGSDPEPRPHRCVGSLDPRPEREPGPGPGATPPLWRRR